jgi:pantoate kinase
VPDAVTYWVAAHLTGIFEIRDESNKILEKGSRGAGLSINRGVKTIIRPNQAKTLEIYFNGLKQDDSEALVTISVLELMLPREDRMGLLIKHKFEVPLSSGFGASAAGALGTAFAVNELFSLNKSELELYQIAHKAEILTKSGLGDVIGLYQGGLEIRYLEGAPGVGKTMLMNNSESWEVATVHLGPLSTSEILTDPQERKRINLAGKDLISDLIANPEFSNFIRLARKFTENAGLWSERMQNIAKRIPQGIYYSQIMLGEGLFLFFREESILDQVKLPKERIIKESVCKNTVQRKS